MIEIRYRVEVKEYQQGFRYRVFDDSKTVEEDGFFDSIETALHAGYEAKELKEYEANKPKEQNNDRMAFLLGIAMGGINEVIRSEESIRNYKLTALAHKLATGIDEIFYNKKGQ